MWTLSVLEVLTLVGFTQRCLVVVFRRFGTTYQSNLQGSSSPRKLDL
jgi:hypothetical protein